MAMRLCSRTGVVEDGQHCRFALSRKQRHLPLRAQLLQRQFQAMSPSRHPLLVATQRVRGRPTDAELWGEALIGLAP
jgi:hypothetical protein